MSKMVILNKEKKVIVFKALGLPPLRLFPGHNEVDKDDFSKYIKNTAAKSYLDTSLFMVDASGLTSAEKTQMQIAKERNDELNKANKLIKTQIKEIASKDKDLKASSKEIDSLKEQNAELLERLAALEEKFAQSEAEGSDNPADDGDDKGKGKGKK